MVVWIKGEKVFSCLDACMAFLSVDLLEFSKMEFFVRKYRKFLLKITLEVFKLSTFCINKYVVILAVLKLHKALFVIFRFRKFKLF